MLEQESLPFLDVLLSDLHARRRLGRNEDGGGWDPVPVLCVAVDETAFSCTPLSLQQVFR